ncbi:MAG TPA: hypothetical protein VNN17_09935, partial [Terriglobia bacterium]|nr:hypothetical protein [Terriglobia bacterium]
MWIRQHGAGTMAMMSLALLFSPSRHAGAQQGPPPESPESTVVFFQYNAAAENPAAATASPALRQKLATAGAPPKPDFLFASAEGFGSGTTVIGAPYSAEATTEIVQTLADG